MAISLSFSDLLRKYEPVEHLWNDIDAFEAFYLRYLREIRSDRIYYTNVIEQELVLEPVDHYPKLHRYAVWQEGFAITGQQAKASLLGHATARNFRQACNMLMATLYLQQVEKDLQHAEFDYGAWNYDPNVLTFWGCALVWDEEIARKTYG